MLALGADVQHAREMVLDDILHGRIELLLYNVCDVTGNKSLGEHQLSVMAKNAAHVETECLAVLEMLGENPTASHPFMHPDFWRCLKRLTRMIQFAASGEPLSASRRKEMRQYAETICELVNNADEDQMDDDFVENCLNLLLLRLIAII